MRIKRILLMLFIIPVFLWNGSMSVFAMNTGFSTEEMEPKEEKTFRSKFHLDLITEEPKKNAITCFDVNEDGLIVIAYRYATKK